MSHSYKIPAIVLKELGASGATWRVVPGGKHNKLVVNNRLCGILSHGGKDAARHDNLNLRTQVRKVLAK